MCTQCPSALARDLDGAFAQLVQHNQDLVFGVSRRMSSNTADAEDLAQDTFVRAYRALRGYDAERIRALHLRGWLAQVCLNLARNRARAAKAAAGGAADGNSGHATPLDEAAEIRDVEHAQPERIAERREAAQRWARLLGGVPERYRAAVALRHVEGLSYPELAAALDRPLNTVKSDVHRGVAFLRAAYELDEALASRNQPTPMRVLEVHR